MLFFAFPPDPLCILTLIKKREKNTSKNHKKVNNHGLFIENDIIQSLPIYLYIY
nr:MAG TPA: hypothetical protein [Caudoviricetes sp.]